VRSTRLVTTGLAAVIALAVSPGWAAAASPVSDDTLADFNAGSPGASTWAIESGPEATSLNGVVRLKPSLGQNFTDPFPSTWTTFAAAPWDPAGTVTSGGGSLSIDGARANTGAMFQPAQTMEFRGIFGADGSQHVGFGNTFEDGPWAMFSTGGFTLPVGLYARTLTAPGQTPIDEPISGVDPLKPHTYRIEWSATGVKYFVDGSEVTSTPPITHPGVASDMRPVVSDLTKGGAAVRVDWLGMGTVPGSGTFTSRVLDAGDARAVWNTLTQTGTGGNLTFETRTGNGLTPDGSWSQFKALGAGNTIQSPAGRYIQYRATFSSAAQSLDKVELSNNLDEAGPTTVIDGAEVNGTTATVRFSSSDADFDRFECRLDSGAFAACTSPKQFTGLAAGSHSVTVRAIDKLGNVGAPVSKSFSVASPAPPSGGGGAGGGGGQPAPAPVPPAAADTTAPKVTLTLASARVSKSGAVSLNVGCPATETSCKVAVALKLGRTTVASKHVTVTGGKQVKLTLKLSKSARSRLAKHGKLKVRAGVTATDAAGNTSVFTVNLTLKARSH
jgi:hypothetical protein